MWPGAWEGGGGIGKLWEVTSAVDAEGQTASSVCSMSGACGRRRGE